MELNLRKRAKCSEASTCQMIDIHITIALNSDVPEVKIQF